jgi:TolB-like protein/Flp pilus assembly protein TadD
LADPKAQRLEALFHQAVELPREERAAFLDAHCGDPALRAELELLLQHDAVHGGDTDSLPVRIPIVEGIRRLLDDSDASIESGRRIGDYRILREIGRGGMGTVYKAVQGSLGRTVALKVLPESFAMDPVRVERFRREARATARIRHPNIVPVHEVGESEGRHYYAMEFIDGPSLEAVLAQARDAAAPPGGAKGSPASDAARAAQAAERMAELAEGLDEAHRLGLVHRDIKPSNILVDRSGRYVLVDFGLVHDVDAESLTGSGQLLGTLSYMPPEQISGGKVDARSDIHGLGVTLFELLTLRKPFEGQNAGEIQEAILHQEPPAPRKLNSRLGSDLETIVLHCLQKSPGRRYASAGELAADLRRFCRGEPILARPRPRWELLVRRAWRSRLQLAAGAMLAALAALVAFLAWPKGVTSLAVLPFVNEAADPGIEYLSDSIPERLMGMLSSVPDLAVRSRSASFRFKGKDVNPAAAGRELRADIVLSGRVAQRDDVLVLGLELVNVRDQTRLWGIRYDRKLDELMKTEDEICREIAARLRVRLDRDAARGDGEHRTKFPAADIAYRRGRLLYSQQTPEALAKSVERFQEAIGIDPGFALAHVGLAEAWIGLGYFQTPKAAFESAIEHARKALDLDPLLGEAHAALGSLRLYHGWDWPEAQRCLDRAVELNPRCVESFPCFVHLMDTLGRPDEALAQVERALHLNPESVALVEELGCTSYYAGRYQEAVRHSREAIELDGGFILAYYNLGRSYGQLGMYAESISTLEKAKAITGGEASDIVSELAFSYARAGRKADAQAVLEELLERKQRAFVDPYPLAFAHIGLGDKESAMAALEEALEVRSSWVPWLKVEPKFFVLHSEPRFRALVQRLKL